MRPVIYWPLFEYMWFPMLVPMCYLYAQQMNSYVTTSCSLNYIELYIPPLGEGVTHIFYPTNTTDTCFTRTECPTSLLLFQTFELLTKLWVSIVNEMKKWNVLVLNCCGELLKIKFKWLRVDKRKN